MMKRMVDIVFSLIGLLISGPILLIFAFLIWLQDYKNPLYIAPRVGKNKIIFKMYKLRSMVANADKTGVDSTSANDMRITAMGRIIRKCKLDEVTQLINVLKGDMSLVGPRPNVLRETQLYTKQEQKLLTVKPGITDFSSIVFSDEGEILKDQTDPDLAYNQLIRPWKSRLGIFYIEHRSFGLDFKIILYTLIAILSREVALKKVSTALENLFAPSDLIKIARRTGELIPTSPPGTDKIVISRV